MGGVGYQKDQKTKKKTYENSWNRLH